MTLVLNYHSPAVSSDTLAMWKGGHATWATACPPYNQCPGIHPHSISQKEDTAASPSA